MSKSSKKKAKVPKITEEEYANYISSLKAEQPPESLSPSYCRETQMTQAKKTLMYE